MADVETATVDARGLLCPEPVMLLHAAVRKLKPGETVRLLATDPSTRRDVPNFCRFLGHEMLEEINSEAHLEYLVRKRAS